MASGTGSRGGGGGGAESRLLTPAGRGPHLQPVRSGTMPGRHGPADQDTRASARVFSGHQAGRARAGQSAGAATPDPDVHQLDGEGCNGSHDRNGEVVQ